MITYRYSLKIDLWRAWNTLRQLGFYRHHKIIHYLPNPIEMFKLWRNPPEGPEIPYDKDITVYWVSSGSNGSYGYNEVLICPRGIEKVGGIKDVIQHELMHIEHPEADDMEHEEKEAYIDQLLSKNE